MLANGRPQLVPHTVIAVSKLWRPCFGWHAPPVAVPPQCFEVARCGGARMARQRRNACGGAARMCTGGCRSSLKRQRSPSRTRAPTLNTRRFAGPYTVDALRCTASWSRGVHPAVRPLGAAAMQHLRIPDPTAEPFQEYHTALFKPCRAQAARGAAHNAWN